ncbi:ARL2BP [Branchiostoma lanceolatum]|uniref:ADP-ribosylation factor-like protein 2-binding protein n=1 Tax=Branchiostoma lanceolatum TaxID=7740 RepID=A0A8K0A6C1_BRALA|nr:ARL2BP [Branchiostoma lanceolatum]
MRTGDIPFKMATAAVPEFDDLEPMDFQEEMLGSSNSSIADTKFDVTVGYIEEIIMDDEFQDLQNNFLDKNYIEFEDTEENKFVYTDIHKEWVDTIEKYLETNLARKMPGFHMHEFAQALESRKDEVCGEIFDMLVSFTDFLAFKELMLDYRAEKEGRSIDLLEDLVITSMSKPAGGPAAAGAVGGGSRQGSTQPQLAVQPATGGSKLSSKHRVK